MEYFVNDNRCVCINTHWHALHRRMYTLTHWHTGGKYTRPTQRSIQSFSRPLSSPTRWTRGKNKRLSNCADRAPDWANVARSLTPCPCWPFYAPFRPISSNLAQSRPISPNLAQSWIHIHIQVDRLQDWPRLNEILRVSRTVRLIFNLPQRRSWTNETLWAIINRLIMND